MNNYWTGFYQTISDETFEKLKEQRRRVANYKITKADWETEKHFAKALKRCKKETEKLIKMHNFIIGHFEGKHNSTIPPKELEPYFKVALRPVEMLENYPLIGIENLVWYNSDRFILDDL